jgi:putative transposase
MERPSRPLFQFSWLELCSQRHVPRRSLRGTAGLVFHVMNRSANRLTLFNTPADYEAFTRVMVEASARVPIPLLVYCLMPNHWHLVLWSRADGDISRYVQWLTGTHAQRWRAASGSVGRGAVYQGRFRWVPVQTDIHLLRVCRYVERNPVRAGLVDRAETWGWSSLAVEDGSNDDRPVQSLWPIPRPADWRKLVDEEDRPSELARIRTSINRGTPYGTAHWEVNTAARLGLPLNERGRPKTKKGSGGFSVAKTLPTPF